MCYMAGRKRSSNYRATSRASRPSQVREAAQPYITTTVGVRELRQNLSVYLEEIKQGRSLIVTDHGRHVAVLGPLPPATSVLDRLVAEGKATPPTRRMADLAPAPDLKLEKPLSQILQEMRDEEVW
jgi:prevent-host-death family protein